MKALTSTDLAVIAAGHSGEGQGLTVALPLAVGRTPAWPPGAMICLNDNGSRYVCLARQSI